MNVLNKSDVPMPAMQFVDPGSSGPKFHVEGQTAKFVPSNVSIGVVELMVSHGTTGYPVR